MAKKLRANQKRQIRFKHPDGTKSAVWQRPDGRWSGYWHPLNADGSLDKSRRSELTRTDPDKLIAQILERETPKKMTLRELVSDWERAHEKNAAPNTLAAYRSPTRRVLEKFGDRPIGDITTTEVSGFLSELADMDYARMTIMLHRNVLSMAYKYAILHGLADRSPVDYAVNPRTKDKQEREPLTEAQKLAVENALDAPFGLFGYLLLYTGLRRGEALALRYEDIDRKKRVIHVTKTLEFNPGAPYQGDGSRYVKAPKTKKSVRDVPLLDPLADALPLGIGGYIFHPDGKPGHLTLSQFQTNWKHYCDALGFAVTPHQFRHTYATILYSLGIGLKEAQKLLGHADVKTTMNIYTHISEELETQTADKLNAYAKRRSEGALDGGIAASL